MSDVRVVIVDDEPLVRSGLRAFIEGDPRLSLAGEARNGRDALALIHAERPDLVLLDVQMPELDGFSVVSALADDLPRAIIFVTAFDHYALRAFDVHAVDYLLKPFEEERFTRAIARACQRLAAPPEASQDDELRRLLRALDARRSGAQRILVKDNGRISVVAAADVDWIEAADNYARLHIGSRHQLVRESMKDLEARLDPLYFARAHRSALVNLTRVRELQPLFGGEYVIILTTGARVTLSRGYRDRFRERLEGGRGAAGQGGE